MRTIEEVKDKIEEYYGLQTEEYISRYDMMRYNGAIEALLWVLGDDINLENNDVASLIKSFSKQFKQLSLFEIVGEGDSNDESN